MSQQQGVNWATRKILRMMPVTIEINQHTDDQGIERIDIENVIGGGATRTTEKRSLNWEQIETLNPTFGRLLSKSRCVELTSAAGEKEKESYVWQGWVAELNEAGLIFSRVESVEHKWVQEQVWGFADVDGERRYIRRIVVEKGSETGMAQLVLDWIC